MPIRICCIKSSAVPCENVSFGAVVVPAKKAVLLGTHLAIITTSGCRPIVVG
jgi:hypothetical protein